MRSCKYYTYIIMCTNSKIQLKNYSCKNILFTYVTSIQYMQI